MAIETQYRLVGDGVLKQKVPVEIDTDEIRKEIIKTLKVNLHSILSKLMDDKAKEYGYDNIISACSYCALPNPFQEESTKFFVWRSSIWNNFVEYFNYIELNKDKILTKEEFIKTYVPDFDF